LGGVDDEKKGDQRSVRKLNLERAAAHDVPQPQGIPIVWVNISLEAYATRMQDTLDAQYVKNWDIITPVR
jgi:hypothetical protein